MKIYTIFFAILLTGLIVPYSTCSVNPHPEQLTCKYVSSVNPDVKTARYFDLDIININGCSTHKKMDDACFSKMQDYCEQHTPEGYVSEGNESYSIKFTE